MLNKINGRRSTHWIKHYIDALAARQLCGRNEVGVAGNENDLIHLSFESQRGDIKAELHVDTFLLRIDLEIVVSKWRKAGFKQPFHACRLQSPLR